MLSTWLMVCWARRTECRAAAAVAEAQANAAAAAEAAAAVKVAEATVAAEKKRADVAEATVAALQAEVEWLRARNWRPRRRHRTHQAAFVFRWFGRWTVSPRKPDSGLRQNDGRRLNHPIRNATTGRR